VKVAFVIGPASYGRCGIGDYTLLLATAVGKMRVRTEIFESKGFGLLRSIRAFQPDVAHLQYPTAGFGKGIAAQLFSLLMPFTVTLHEVEGTHFLRRLSLYPLARATHVIFTCESNRKYAVRWAPWLRPRSSVIPLASNMPTSVRRQIRTDSPEVIYFGLIRPDKGIEEVLELTRQSHMQGLPLRVRIIGGSPAVHAQYLQEVQASSLGLPVEWDLNVDTDAVADRLANGFVAYLPYPDGASERRTSLLAALSNGLAVITTRGKFTPAGLEGAVRFCETPAEAVNIVRDLLSNPADRESLIARGLQYARQFSWESIAESHVGIYDRITTANCALGPRNLRARTD
jgi:glycosyltransferase involved in cell wall biosynthesis